MEKDGTRERRGRGFKHDLNIQLGIKRLRTSHEVFVDSLRFPHVAWHGVGALDWHDLKVRTQGGEP